MTARQKPGRGAAWQSLLDTAWAEADAGYALITHGLVYLAALHLLRAWQLLGQAAAEQDDLPMAPAASVALLEPLALLVFPGQRTLRRWQETLPLVLEVVHTAGEPAPGRFAWRILRRRRRAVETQCSLLTRALGRYERVLRWRHGWLLGRLGPPLAPAMAAARGFVDSSLARPAFALGRLSPALLLILALGAGIGLVLLARGLLPDHTGTGTELVAGHSLHGVRIVRLADLANPKAENAFWGGQGTSSFYRKLHIRVEPVSHARRFEVSLDRNDVYLLQFLNREEVLGQIRVPPRVVGLGLHIRQFDVPAPAVREGFDTIEITPLEGDGLYSLGHLILH